MIGPKPYSTNPATLPVGRIGIELRDYADAAATLASYTTPAPAGEVVRAEEAYLRAAVALARAVATEAGVPVPTTGTLTNKDRAAFEFRPWVSMNLIDGLPIAGIVVRHLPCWAADTGMAWECSMPALPYMPTGARLDELMREHTAECPSLTATPPSRRAAMPAGDPRTLLAALETGYEEAVAADRPPAGDHVQAYWTLAARATAAHQLIQEYRARHTTALAATAAIRGYTDAWEDARTMRPGINTDDARLAVAERQLGAAYDLIQAYAHLYEAVVGASPTAGGVS